MWSKQKLQNTQRQTLEKTMTTSQTWTTHSVTQKREEEEKLSPINKI